MFALRSHANAVNALAVAPDGRTLVTANADRSARVWDLVSGRERRSLAGAGSAVAFSPDGKIIASAGEDKTVRLWTPPAGASCAPCMGTHTKYMRSRFPRMASSWLQAATTIPCGCGMPRLDANHVYSRDIRIRCVRSRLRPMAHTLASGSYD